MCGVRCMWAPLYVCGVGVCAVVCVWRGAVGVCVQADPEAQDAETRRNAARGLTSMLASVPLTCTEGQGDALCTHDHCDVVVVVVVVLGCVMVCFFVFFVFLFFVLKTTHTRFHHT